MDLLGPRQVDPIHQSPQTRAYGFFAQGPVPTSLIFTHLVSFFSLTSSPAVFPDPLPPPINRSRGFRHACGTTPTTDRASLAVSLALIGSLTPMPLGDSASPPEVTLCSSVP